MFRGDIDTLNEQLGLDHPHVPPAALEEAAQ